MGWWPFSKKSKPRPIPDVIRRDTRSWLSDLQEVCERNFDSPEARRQIRQMATEWSDESGWSHGRLFARGIKHESFQITELH